MAINYTTKYSPLIDERFKHSSITDRFAGKKYEFDGVKSIKVYSIDTVGLNDYNRSATANRFGTPNELGDTLQTMTMAQDKSFTFTIDRGNASDQMNIKHCNEQLKSNWDEVCTPTIDKYRFGVWANGAGTVTATANSLTKSNIIETIMTASAAMSNKLVPKKGRALFIGETLYIATKISTEIIGIDTLGAKSVANGVVGRIDGMDIVVVPDSYLPTGVQFMIKYTNATVDPMKLKTMRVQKNPPGIDGDLGECRFYHDAFVLGNKAYGIAVSVLAANVVAAPTATVAAGKATLASTTDNAVIKYTLDGTNPKNSDTAQTYSAAVTVTAGQTIRFAATASDLLGSGIVEKVIE